MDIYKKAAQLKLRFDSVRGPLTVEQLFDMPLTATNGFSLDDVSRVVLSQKPAQQTSLVAAAVSKTDEENELRILVLKDVIQHHTDRAAASVAQAQRNQRIQALSEELESRKGAELREKGTDELAAELAALKAG